MRIANLAGRAVLLVEDGALDIHKASGGTLGAARLTGLNWRTSASLGLLMNTRGLMELIVLHVGLTLKVISPALFAMMVLMALATTMATAPLLQLLEPRRTAPPEPGGEMA